MTEPEPFSERLERTLKLYASDDLVFLRRDFRNEFILSYFAKPQQVDFGSTKEETVPDPTEEERLINEALQLARGRQFDLARDVAESVRYSILSLINFLLMMIVLGPDVKS